MFKESEAYDRSYIIDFLGFAGLAIEIDDLLAHAQRLGKIARLANTKGNSDFHEWDYPYLKALLQAFTVAKSFIHFVSFGGISPFMLGVLKLAAQRVYVDGVVSASRGSGLSLALSAASENQDEARRLDLRIIAAEGVGEDLPHQKLVIIDGLLAFKGSANLNEYAWRKAERNLEGDSGYY